jgi:putative membrane protein
MTAALVHLAHVGHEAARPSELWHWHPDPLVLAGLALLAVAYRQGVVTARHRTAAVPRRQATGSTAPAGPRPTAAAVAAAPAGSAGSARSTASAAPASSARSIRSGSQVAAFVAGLVTLAVALVSPLDSAAAALFSAHMVQHLLLVVVAAPLLVAGRTGRMALMALPGRPRRQVRSAIARRPVRRVADLLAHPLAVWGLGTAVLWVWHLPSPYEAALAHEAVHAVEHLTLLATALLLWDVVLGGPRRRLSVPIAVLVLFATGLQGAALGAVLVFARSPLYAAHEPTAPLWGLTPLEDQQLAGGLMWVPPGLVYLGVIAALVVRWFAALDAANPADALDAADAADAADAGAVDRSARTSTVGAADAISRPAGPGTGPGTGAGAARSVGRRSGPQVVPELVVGAVVEDRS